MIDENRKKHIFGVAKLMKDNAKTMGLDEEEMFTLGLLHDIGYEFGGSEEHHTKGAEILKKQCYKYFKEVQYHGMPTKEYSSTALDLLNFADMHISKDGSMVSFQARLWDIAKRRGYDSPHYQNCKAVIDALGKKYILTDDTISLKQKETPEQKNMDGKE